MIKDGARLAETTATTGTGAIALAGAVSGFRTLRTKLSDGDQCIYWLLDANQTDWELGLGTLTYGTPDSLARTTILDSSNSGAAIALSAGTHEVIIGPAAGYATGQLNMQDLLLQRPELKDYSETVPTPSDVEGTLTLDMETGNVFEVTLTGNVTTLAINNPPASGKAGSLVLILKQDATGSRTFAFPASCRFAGGTAPTLSSVASAIDILTFITTDAGTSWYVMVGGTDFKAAT